MACRIAYICDWLPPDFGAIGQYTLLEARETAAAGHNVLLGGFSTSQDSTEYEDPGDGSLKIRRLYIDTYDKARLAHRLLWTLRANTLLIRRLWRELRHTDEIHFTGSPPFILYFVWFANLFLRKRLVYRIADFHPECLMATMDRVPLALRVFQRLTIALRKRVDRIEAIGEDQRQRLIELGIPEQRIAVVRYDSPVSIGPETAALAPPEELGGYRTLLYSGNLGVAHDYDTFLEGYRRHHREGAGRMALWLNATGPRADRLEEELRSSGLPVARGHPVPLEELANLMVTPDAHLITLRDEFVGYVVPSKMYACIDSGRPILFVGSTASDVDLLCRDKLASDYQQAEVGGAAAVFTALERLSRRCDTAAGMYTPSDAGSPSANSRSSRPQNATAAYASEGAKLNNG